MKAYLTLVINKWKATPKQSEGKSTDIDHILVETYIILINAQCKVQPDS